MRLMRSGKPMSTSEDSRMAPESMSSQCIINNNSENEDMKVLAKVLMGVDVTDIFLT